jgi:transposase-like protein
MPSKYRRSTNDYLNQPHTGTKAAPTGTSRDLNLATLSKLFVDEDKAREFLENKRWPNGAVCPHCECKETYTLTAKEGSKSPVRKGVHKCKSCRKQFTVRIGTIFEESKIPLSKWLMAIHLMTSSKKGVSSHQIARECGITQKSAWFLNHRIREAMKQEPMASMLTGTVEADEVYMGGKTRLGKRGRGSERKTPVLVLIERDGGRAHAAPLEHADSKSIKGEIRRLVNRNAEIHSDEWAAYNGLDREFADHRVVEHHAKQYARIDEDGTLVTTNSAESFNALMKRGHYGIFHHYSKHHMHRYCNEFSFRWSQRGVTDGERMVEAIRGAEGKRLMYREPITSGRQVHDV